MDGWNPRYWEKLHNSLFSPSQIKVLRPVTWRIVKSSIKRKRPARGRYTIVRDEDRIIVYHLLSTYYVLHVFMSLFNLSNNPEKQILFCLFYRWDNWDSERLVTWPKLSNIGSTSLDLNPNLSHPKPTTILLLSDVPFWEVCRVGV